MNEKEYLVYSFGYDIGYEYWLCGHGPDVDRVDNADVIMYLKENNYPPTKENIDLFIKGFWNGHGDSQYVESLELELNEEWE